jgi:cysteine desulfurase
MKVYMDYAATTPVDRRVLEAMKPYSLRMYGNTMSLHSWGRAAKEALEDSRTTVASFLKATPKEVIFTGSATEANNTAVKGVAFANKEKGRHIVISSIEHDSVLETARWLEKQGFEITYLPVDNYGLVKLNKLEEEIRKDTILVSIVHANNEIGVIQDAEQIGKICRERNVLFHSDAAQSCGKIPIDVKKMDADLLTVSAHKMYGPKGVGALYIKEGTKMEPWLQGGGHEFGLRSATVNVAGIVGFAEAVNIQKKEMNSDAKTQIKFRDKLIKETVKINNSHLNGHPMKRLPNNANFWFAFIEGESLVMQLNMEGIAASTGSACSSESSEPSHVLLAIGLKSQEAYGSLRLTLGKYTTDEEVGYALDVLPQAVDRLRRISPFNKG